MRTLLLTSLLIVWCACSPQFEAPPTAVIACTTTADCPAGLSCLTSFTPHRCVKPEDIDGTAPMLVGEITIDRTLLRLGQVATVSFDVDELLGEVPKVTVKLSNPVVLQWHQVDLTSKHFSFTFEATDGLPQGVDCPVEVVLTDRSANSSSFAARTPLRFDYSAPRVRNVVVAGSPARTGDTVTVAFSSSEPLGAAPSVTLPGDRSLQPGTPTDDHDYLFTYTVQDGDPEGTFQVLAALADQAGNETSAETLGEILVDRTPPQLDGTATLTPVARKGSFVQLTFQSSEALRSVPTVRFGDLPMTHAGSTGNVHAFTHQIADADGKDGDLVPVSITMEDLARNAATVPGPSTRLDFTGPTLGAHQVTPGRVGRSGVVTATFDLDDAGTRVLSVGSAGMEFDRSPDSSGLHAVYTYTLSGGEDVGMVGVSAELEDAAGNLSRWPVGSFVIDLTAPGLAAPAQVDHVFAKPGDEVAVSFTASEELGAPPVVTGAGASWKLRSQALNAYVYSAVLPVGVAQGVATLSLSLVDQAQNPSPALDGGSFTVDTVPPKLLAAPTLDPARVRKGMVVTASFDSDEELGSSPTATLGGRAMVRSGQSGNHYVFAYTADGTEPASAALSLVLSDRAGNSSGPLAGGTVAFDFALPKVSGATVSPELARSPQGQEADVKLTASFEVDEPVAPGLSVTAGPLPLSCQSAPPGYQCSALVPRSLSSGNALERTWGVDATLSDLAGNLLSTRLGSVTFDFTPPSVRSCSVRYLPDDTNLLSRVLRARAGTTVLVNLSASEPVAWPSAQLTASPAGVLTFVPTSTGAADASYTAAVPPSAKDGSLALSADLTDAAGNRATSPCSAAVSVKTSAPRVSVVQAQVTYLRSPTGNAASEDLGSFTLPAGPYFALAPNPPLTDVASLPASTFSLETGHGAIAAVRVFGDAGGTSLLGSMQPNPDGTWPRLRLAEIDVPFVWASGVDDAGNETVPTSLVRLANNEFVATANPRLAGQNPHALVGTTFADTTLSPTASALALAAGVEGIGGSHALLGSVPQWRPRARFATRPPLCIWSSAAWDSARGRLVVYGGTGTNCDRVWEWDGATWIDASPPTYLPRPPARSMHAMAYDSARRRTVLFGGNGSSGMLADLWEWDGTSWTELHPTPAPAARRQAGLAFDSWRGRLVLFGGQDASLVGLADTWEFDGEEWTNATPASSPPARYGHGMAFDGGRGRVVMGFGRTGGTATQDLWEWNGTAWTNRTPSTSPPVRYSTSFAFDPSLARVVMVGGEGTSPVMLLDVWEWNGAAGTWAHPTDLATGRYQHCLAYDGNQRGVLVLGGNDGTPSGGRHLTVRNHLVHDHEPGVPGPLRGLVYVPTRDRLDGLTSDGTTFSVWGFNGSAWTRLVNSGPTPLRNETSFTSLGNDHALLFGGRDSTYTALQDTWDWDGTTNTWTLKSPATRPSARYEHAVAYSGTSGQAVLFGGRNSSTAFQDTYLWNGTTWSLVSVAKPPPARSGHKMVYSTACSCVLLHGGVDGSGTRLNDTWTFNGTAWSNVTGTVKPPIAYANEQDLVYLGKTGSALLLVQNRPLYPTPESAEMWAWNGSWSKLAVLGGGGPRFVDLTAGYDSDRGLLFTHGWRDGSNTRNESFEYDLSNPRRPGVTFTVDGAAVGFDQGAPIADTVTSFQVRSQAGGASESLLGASLYAWLGWGAGADFGEWSLLGVNSVGLPPQAGSMALGWTISTLPARYYQPRDRAWTFQVRSRYAAATLGPEASVAVDYLEVRLRYPSP